MSDDGIPIPKIQHIAREGEAVRILGAWLGNHIDDGSVWTPLIERVNCMLEKWEKINPTIEGRKLVTQMIIGGMTQYLTSIQEMPKFIKQKLMKRQRCFIWGERTMLPVNAETLYSGSKKCPNVCMIWKDQIGVIC
jgi:hypothetical protein